MKTDFCRSTSFSLCQSRLERRGRTRAWKDLSSLLIILCSLLVLAGCSSDNPSAQKRAASPTPVLPTATATSAVPSGTVLYHTNWSQGLADWSVPGAMSAHASKGQLRLTCGKLATMFLAYRPVVADFALEVPIQIVDSPTGAGTFSLIGQQSSDKDGYLGGAASLEKKFPFHGQFDAFVQPIGDSSIVYTADFSPGTNWYTYRIEIQHGTFTFYVNGIRHGQAISTRTDDLSNGPLGISCGYLALNIGALTITAL